MWANENLVNRDRVCIYASPEHLWTFVLNPLKYQCLEKYVDFAKIKKPFLVYWITKGDSKKLPLPSCSLIHEEVRNLPISQSRLAMGQLFYCNPALQQWMNAQRNPIVFKPIPNLRSSSLRPSCFGLAALGNANSSTMVFFPLSDCGIGIKNSLSLN